MMWGFLAQDCLRSSETGVLAAVKALVRTGNVTGWGTVVSKQLQNHRRRRDRQRRDNIFLHKDKVSVE